MMRVVGLFVGFVLGIGCAPKSPPDGDSSGTGSSAGEESGADSASESGGGTSTGASDTEDAACLEMCQAYAACWPGADVAACQNHCARWFAETPSAECRETAVAARLCVATLTCGDLFGSIYRSSCQAELELESIRCSPTICPARGSGAADCISWSGCNGLPMLGVACTGDTCTCMLDRVEGPSCEVPEGGCRSNGPAVTFSECCPVGP
ncbi:hypothetical protein [Nannocystis sp. SCPEA4]|uniref:hypothetical protein n=1 Tax=Nannocystis sp. SCPEA4 TaxID=2996787 RepID=UPI002271B376|nr:hypothetical protein [Nannocystis sp. SCPEA4]MCY1054190.1 hypothetical protein [Nannocystis sp. SCPEA4]